MATLTVTSDHSARLDSGILARAGETQILAVVVDATIQAAAVGKYAYLHFLTADGTAWYKGPYDCTSGTFNCTLGDTDIVLLHDGELDIQFVLTDTEVV